MKNIIYRFSPLLIVLGILSCGDEFQPVNDNENSDMGSAVMQLIWPQIAAQITDVQYRGAQKIPNPADVLTIRVTFSAADMSDVSATFDAVSQSSGTVNGIPVGNDRMVTVEGLDIEGEAIYLGNKAGITINANQNTDVGAVSMKSTDLVAFFPFNGNTNDEGVYGNDGIVNGATLAADRFAVANSAYNFDGVNDYISIPYNNSMDFPNNFTISVWARGTSPYSTGSTSGIVGKQNLGPYYFLIDKNNILEFRVTDSAGNWVSIDTSLNISSTEWYHYVLIYRVSEYMGIYVDGVEQSSSTTGIPDNLTSTSGDLWIGSRPWFTAPSSPAYYFQGEVDDVRLYNRALSETEILTLYNESLPSAPTNVSASSGDTQVTISWDAVSGATSYSVYMDTATGVTKASVNTNSTTTISYTWTSLTNDTPYYFVVTADNGAGESEVSSEVSSIPQLISTVDLVAYYPFNGNANDESGNGKNGTVNGATLAADRFGNVNRAYNFDGLDDHIDIGSDVKPLFPITVSAWINTNALGTTAGIFLNDIWDPDSYYHGIHITISSDDGIATGQGSGFASSTTRSQFSTAPVAITVDNWHHVVVMFVEFNDPVFYIDNVEFPIDLGPGSGTTMNYSSNPGVIGNRNTEYFNGFIDDVRVYSRVLTINEISTLFFESP